MEPVQQRPLVLNYFFCYICQQSPLQPRLCTRCAKAFCHNCLMAVVNTLRPQCPSCGQRLPLQNYLQPEFVFSLVEQVAQNVRRDLKRNEERQLCGEHELPLSYYCVDCNVPLCGDCGLLTKQHFQHKFMSYRDIYQRVKAKVKEEFPRFESKIKVLEGRKGQLRENMQSLQNQYRRYKKYFEEAFLTYTEKVEREASGLQEKVAAREEANSRRLQELEILKDTIYEEMETKTQITLIKQAKSLIESIGALAAQELPAPVHGESPSQLEDLVELVPDYTTWTYTLTEYSKKSGIVYSEEKSLNGVDWRLKIYPRGNGLARDKFISIFVEMTKGLVGQKKYEYRIELLNAVYPELAVRREYCSTFQIGECWGYNQFEPLDQLVSKEYIQGDALTFKVGVRNRTYRSFAEQQQLYIARLTRQLQRRQMGIRPEESSANLEERSLSVGKIKQFLIKESKERG